MEDIKFNVNNYVRVKLTDTGKKIIHAGYMELIKNYPRMDYDFKLPKEDKDGFSKWQLHYLMDTFGNHMSLTADPPFETDIFFECQ